MSYDANLTKYMDFLVKKTKNAAEPTTFKEIFDEYSRLDPDRSTYSMCYDKFHHRLAPIMNELNTYSIRERVRVMLTMGGKVSKDFLTTIEKLGTVQLDEKRRILKYASKDGKFKIEGARSEFMDFLIQQTRDAVRPMTSTSIAKEFCRIKDRQVSVDTFNKKFRRNLAPNMSRWSSYLLGDRIRMMFVLKGTVRTDFLAEIEKSGTVQLDDQRRIVRYASNDGMIELEEKTSGVKRRRSTKSSNTPTKRREITENELSDTDDVEVMEIVDGYVEQESASFDFEELVNREASYNLDQGHLYREILEAPLLENRDSKFNPFNAKSGRQAEVQRSGTFLNESEGTSTNAQESFVFRGFLKQEPVFEQFHIQNMSNNLVNLPIPPEIEETPVQEGHHVEPSGITGSDGIRLHKFLNSLELMLTSLESDTLNDLMQEIEEIRRRTDEILPSELVITTLQTFFLGITRKFRPETSAPSKSAKECLRIFKYALLWLKNPLLYDLQKRVQDEIENHEADGKVLLIADVQQGIRNILFTVV
ncbi:SPK domain-containing protein [Caenorhabditis elegans]|uniref:SPK domain-containing protein n=1 Tax=Caenorhabditis elegans TaxID=6239 RepID=O61745_CAEEL|nr:SPK domain-containing protein [Caenorhabditis elegans]CCD61304.1 SPK domain-containing protein [Caenorhabditis elegans]|eukprot:NP_492806.1 Uncharacterized protein CELE_B0205.9 [Caenorhabditis elegans]